VSGEFVESTCRRAHSQVAYSLPELPMTDKRLVLTTVGSRDEANTIATELVSRRLAACVNIVGPIASVYHWQGDVERSDEFLLMIKTAEYQMTAVQEALRSLHSYKIPELIALIIDSGFESYLDWIGASVRR
jgi:periplasmic divalent cation tolerance protein